VVVTKNNAAQETRRGRIQNDAGNAHLKQM